MVGHEVSQYNIVNLPTYLKSYKRRKGAVKIVCRMNGFFLEKFTTYNIESHIRECKDSRMVAAELFPAKSKQKHVNLEHVYLLIQPL
mgnify:FL=1